MRKPKKFVLLYVSTYGDIGFWKDADTLEEVKALMEKSLEEFRLGKSGVSAYFITELRHFKSMVLKPSLEVKLYETERALEVKKAKKKEAKDGSAEDPVSPVPEVQEG